MNSRISRQTTTKYLFTTVVLGILVVSLLLFFLPSLVSAVPEGASLTLISNSTKVNTGGATHTAQKGTINYVQLSSTQQNNRWKAYSGNVTGSFVLQDSSGFNLYDWTLTSSITGTVLASRNSTMNWGSINCTNQTVLGLEQEDLEFSFSGIDNINNTFNSTNHTQVLINNLPMISCPTVYTFQNSTRQPFEDSNNVFQEILIQDNLSAIAYATKIEQNAYSYATGPTADFQLLVPDYGDLTNTATVTYYFFVELT